MSQKQKNLFSLGGKIDNKAVKKQNRELADKLAPYSALDKKEIRLRQSMISKIEAISSYDFNHIVINDNNSLERFFVKAKMNGILAIDTETSGLDVMNDFIVGISLYTPGELPCYVPISHIDYLTSEKCAGQLDADDVIKQLNNLGGTKLFFHNAKFDLLMIRNNWGVKINAYWDTLIASILLNENEPHGLKYLYDTYVDIGDTSKSFEELFGKMPFQYVPIEKGSAYAAKDPYMTYELAVKQALTFNGTDYAGLKSLFKEIEMPLIEVLCEMKINGVYIDKEFAAKLSKDYGDKLAVVIDQINSLLSKYQGQIDLLPVELRSKLDSPINLASPLQLSILLYDVLKLKNPSAKKPRSTDEDTLVALAKVYPKEKILSLILEYRRLAKLVSTYIDKIPTLVNDKTGRLHGDLNQIGADTGRMSSQSPNLQNIPAKTDKDIRKMFVAEADHFLIGGDYSQQEPRILTHICKDPKMVWAYNNGKDLYAWAASMVYKLPYEQCLEFFPDGSVNKKGKGMRDSLKVIFLGIMYGMGVSSIAVGLGVSKSEAQYVFDMFAQEYPYVLRFVESTIKFGKTNGYVETVLHRRRRLPDLQLPLYDIKRIDGAPIPTGAMLGYISLMNDCSWKERTRIINENKSRGIIIKDNSGYIAQAERQAANSVIQGTAADMTKKALILIHRNKELRNLGFKLQLQVHDEIIGSAPRHNTVKVCDIIRGEMLEAAKIIDVPMKVDVWVAERWYGEPINL